VAPPQWSLLPSSDFASLRTALAVGLFAGAGAGAGAAAAAPAQSKDWSGQVTLWLGASVTGDFTPFDGAPTLSFARSLSEVLEDADGAFFVTGLACRGA
jgi:hypothetical protein